MTERIIISPEVQRGEQSHTPERAEADLINPEAEIEAQGNKLEQARQEVEQASGNEKGARIDTLSAPDRSEAVVAAPPASQSLKDMTFQKEINHIRHQLNKIDKLGSKIIHLQGVRQVSELSSKTVSRPSGLLGGGITAFIGTTGYLYYAKHIGLKYNYTVFLLLLVLGFVLGLIIEACIRLLRGRRLS